MEYFGSIYIIWNSNNKKIRVGQTTNKVNKRWSAYKSNAKKNMRHPLYDAMNKYGYETFTMEMIYSSFSKEDLDAKEEYFVEFYNSIHPNGYNLLKGGSCGAADIEFRKKRSEDYKGRESWNKGKSLTEEHKRNIGIGGTGRVHKEESKQLIGDAHRGKEVSEETRKIQSDIAKERYANPENHPMYNKTHSDETKEKQAAKKRGKTYSYETNQSKGDHCRGKAQTPEQIAKRTESRRKTMERKRLEKEQNDS